MSGHNKWSKIKNAKASNDAANSKIFSKLGREIAVAVKQGGGDPANNPRLKAVIAKARTYNMPNDNINRSIKKALGDGNMVNYESITYEGYGPAGSAVIVYALTDNKNRTASDVRHLFDKFGGSLGATGCVSYLFDKKGSLVVLKGVGISEDDIMMHALESGSEDVEICDEYYQIYTTPENFEAVKKYFEDNNIPVEDASIEMIPQNYVNLSDEKLKTFKKLVENLDDNDDVQEVVHNVENADDEE